MAGSLGQNQHAQLSGLQFVEAAVVNDFYNFVALEQALAFKWLRILVGWAKERGGTALVGLKAEAARRIIERRSVEARLQHDEFNLWVLR